MKKTTGIDKHNTAKRAPASGRIVAAHGREGADKSVAKRFITRTINKHADVWRELAKH